MSTIKLSQVISCSSEDPSFPAKNLLQESRFLKWKCKSHEPEICVILQLETSSKIHNIDLGNENSAFVEVLVGRSASPDTFHTILGASAFMSPNDSKNQSNGNQVRMFNYDNLSKPHVDENWDRIKIVCCQPFNRSIQYGLSFIKLTSPENKAESSNSIGRFQLKENQNTNIQIGSIFAKHKNRQTITNITGAAAIREANQNILTNSLNDQPSPGTSKINRVIKKETIINNDINKNDEQSSQSPITYPQIINKQKTPKEINKEINNSPKQIINKTTTTPKEKIKLNDIPNSSRGIKRSQEQPHSKKKPKNVSKPFYQLLSGVVIVISGIQNPERANIRSKALEMGAKYKADWDNESTHLICAFTNTPKFNQVRGKGKIVRKQWVEECYTKRKRIPWRRFALDSKDKQIPESEEEIIEELSADESDIESNLIDPISDSRDSPSDSSTENDVNDIFENDTDEELNIESEDTTIPDFINIFSNITFFISDYDNNKINDIKRLIIGFKGKITDDISSSTYIISNNDQKAKENDKVIHGDWIWKCCMDKKLHPIDKYKL